jgi:hypothetical protein
MISLLYQKSSMLFPLMVLRLPLHESYYIASSSCRIPTHFRPQQPRLPQPNKLGFSADSKKGGQKRVRENGNQRSRCVQMERRSVLCAWSGENIQIPTEISH